MYKHNYEKLTIPEAQSIIAGTFVQDTTSIPGECITRSYVQTLCSSSNKTITGIYPEQGDDNELLCYFEVQDNRIDPMSVTIQDVIVYVGDQKTSRFDLHPTGSSVSDDTVVTWNFGEGYEQYFSVSNHKEYVYINGIKRTGEENKISYTVKVGDLTSNTAYIIVKDKKDQQQDMLNQGNTITLVYNITDLGKNAGDYLTVYNSGYTNPTSLSRVDYIWAVSTEGVTQEGVNPFELPIKNVTNNVRKDDQFWIITITDDMIVDTNKVILYLQFPKSQTTIPEEIELDNPDIEKIYIPSPYTRLDRSILFRNESLKTVIIDSTINDFVQNCLSYIPSLENIYIGASQAPSLSQVYYPGFTFVATDQGKRGNTASNVKIHVPSTATGYNESESDVWKWPGCFKATEGNNEVRYGNYKNQTLKLSSYPKDVQAINTWSLVRDYDSQNILYILYDRDPSTGAKKVQS